jgi:hypothetical protein
MSDVLSLQMLQMAGLDTTCNSNVSCDSNASCRSANSCVSNNSVNGDGP